MPKVVQTRYVVLHARDAIRQRLGRDEPSAILGVERTGRRVRLHVNSGGNSIAVEQKLRAAGYRVEPVPYDGHGACLLVSAGQ